jgi:hypothetical protein
MGMVLCVLQDLAESNDVLSFGDVHPEQIRTLAFSSKIFHSYFGDPIPSCFYNVTILKKVEVKRLWYYMVYQVNGFKCTQFWLCVSYPPIAKVVHGIKSCAIDNLDIDPHDTSIDPWGLKMVFREVQWIL